MTKANEKSYVPRMPRVKGLPVVGCVPALLSGQFRFLEKAVETHGRIFELDLGVTSVTIVADPEAAATVLVERAGNFDKGEDFWEGGRELLGRGLALSEGELWRRQRKLMQPKFQQRLVESYRSTIEETVGQELEALPLGEPVDFAQWSDTLLSLLTIRILFGSALDPTDIDELRRSMSVLFHAVLPGIVLRNLPRWLPRPGQRRLAAARRTVDDHILRLIAEGRGRSEPSHDLLGTLIRATDESGVMSDQQLRDEAVLIYLGGYETTGVALAWILWLLARHPKVRSDLLDELEASDGAKPLLHACIQEGLRMYPSAPVIPRRAVTDEVLGGFPVRAGTTVLVSPWLIHHDPELWPRPHDFDPRRFMDGDASQRPRLAWVPFGAGQRLCIGKALAMLELGTTIELFLRRFVPTSVDEGALPEPRLSTTLKSSKELLLSLEPRTRASAR